MIKLLIGGSPCTHWSIAQKNNRETKAEGIGWELFKNYLIAKEKFKPDFFLYENNKSASQAIKDQIATELGVGVDPDVRFTYINSALVSAQNRERFYVTNFGDISQPEDRGVFLKDVIEGCTDRNKAKVIEPVNPLKSGKARCVTAGYANKGSKHILESNYSDNPSKQTWDSVAEPVRVGALPRPNGELSTSQAMRIYSVDGKTVTQSAGGGGLGAKTGLYAIPVNETSNGKSQTIKAQYNNTSVQNICCYKSTYGATGVAISATEQDKEKRQNAKNAIDKVYEVQSGEITIKGKQYPVKLADGYYIIRKLTVTECARLQTMPDDYCRAVSNTQAYKGLGNGWTAEVIIHILNGALKNIPKDEEIIVLSMYDGIGTGRYCLDKMGFTNVKYFAYEIDKYAKQIAMSNYPDIIQMGDAFDLRNPDWTIGY